MSIWVGSSSGSHGKVDGGRIPALIPLAPTPRRIEIRDGIGGVVQEETGGLLMMQRVGGADTVMKRKRYYYFVFCICCFVSTIARDTFCGGVQEEENTQPWLNQN